MAKKRARKPQAKQKSTSRGPRKRSGQARSKARAKARPKARSKARSKARPKAGSKRRAASRPRKTGAGQTAEQGGRKSDTRRRAEASFIASRSRAEATEGCRRAGSGSSLVAQPGPERIGGEDRAPGAPGVDSATHRNKPGADRRRRRRGLGGGVLGRRRGARRRQPDAGSGSSGRHRTRPRNRVRGQRGVERRREDRKTRSEPVGARSRVSGGLHR